MEPIFSILAVGGTDRVIQAMARIDDLIAGGHPTSAMEEVMLALQSAPTYLALHQRMAEMTAALGLGVIDEQDAVIRRIRRRDPSCAGGRFSW